MTIKYSVILTFMGQLKDRFCYYGERESVAQRFAKIAQIPNVSGVEIIYPQDVGGVAAVDDIKALCGKHQLAIATVNLNVKSEPHWRDGSFTSKDPHIRRKAVGALKEAMDVAATLGCNLVTTAPLNDGYDYPFEIDYAQAWDWLVEGISEGASHRPDVRISVEYKRSEPRARVLLDSAAKALLLCTLVGKDNVGVTMDMGHALYAGESSAEAVALLGRAGRLFLVHVNDNYRNWDWDLVPGTVNWWDMVEMFYALEQLGYDGWFTADVFPARIDPVKAFDLTYRMMKEARNLVHRVGLERIQTLVRQGSVTDAFTELLDDWQPGARSRVARAG